MSFLGADCLRTGWVSGGRFQASSQPFDFTLASDRGAALALGFSMPAVLEALSFYLAPSGHGCKAGF